MTEANRGTTDGSAPIEVTERGFAPFEAECGHIITMDGRYLSDGAEQVPLKADGERCSITPKLTYNVDGVGEVALCHVHRENVGRLLDAVEAEPRPEAEAGR